MVIAPTRRSICARSAIASAAVVAKLGAELVSPQPTSTIVAGAVLAFAHGALE